MSEHEQHSDNYNYNDKDQNSRREVLTPHADSRGGEHHCDSDDPPHPSPSNKRPKRPFLQFSGVRHTRVGTDYQITNLPPLDAAAQHHQPKPAIPVEPEDGEPSPPNNSQHKDKDTDTATATTSSS